MNREAMTRRDLEAETGRWSQLREEDLERVTGGVASVSVVVTTLAASMVTANVAAAVTGEVVGW
jgi:hypothetical protein